MCASYSKALLGRVSEAQWPNYTSWSIALADHTSLLRFEERILQLNWLYRATIYRSPTGYSHGGRAHVIKNDKKKMLTPPIVRYL